MGSNNRAHTLQTTAHVRCSPLLESLLYDSTPQRGGGGLEVNTSLHGIAAGPMSLFPLFPRFLCQSASTDPLTKSHWIGEQPYKDGLSVSPIARHGLGHCHGTAAIYFGHRHRDHYPMSALTDGLCSFSINTHPLLPAWPAVTYPTRARVARLFDLSIAMELKSTRFNRIPSTTSHPPIDTYTHTHPVSGCFVPQ